MGHNLQCISKYRLGELGEFRNGANFSQEDYGSGFPIVNVKQLYSGRFASMHDLHELSAAAVSRPESLFLRYGDILFARSSVKASGAGQVAMVGPCQQNAVFSGFIIRFRISATNLVVPEYLNYLLRSPSYRELLTRIATGTTITNLSQDTLAALPIELPSLLEQQAVASVLGALDEKIELNRRMSGTLESMARALFHSWFVAFDPVRAKQQGREPAGLDPAIAALFPAEFVPSQLGEIPKSWIVVRLDDIASVVMGLSPKGDSYNSDGIGIPLINGPVEFGDYFPVKTKWTEAATRFAADGDLIFCVRGSTTGRRVISDGEYGIGRGVCSIHAKGGFRGFLYQTINANVDRLLEKTTGSVFPSLNTPDIKGFQVLMPSSELLQQYECAASPIIRQIQHNHRESGTLAALRDTLLPKLLSGKLSVADSTRIVEKAI